MRKKTSCVGAAASVRRPKSIGTAVPALQTESFRPGRGGCELETADKRDESASDQWRSGARVSDDLACACGSHDRIEGFLPMIFSFGLHEQCARSTLVVRTAA